MAFQNLFAHKSAGPSRRSFISLMVDRSGLASADIALLVALVGIGFAAAAFVLSRVQS